ncbi:MAG: hypothetical protein IPP66_22750 [Anaerolineales bacterium]|nr:hypothetical protein [Anaerolineales bacterium]
MNNSVGIIFSFQSHYYRLADIEWGADNSFYFLPSQHETEVGTRVKSYTEDSGRLVIKPNELEYGKFPTRKISRHQSGFYHIKDVTGSGGNREKDGLRGPAFRETSGFYVFLVACPQEINTMVKTEPDSNRDVIINLPDWIEPFSVQFAAHRKNVNIELKTRPGELLGDGVVQINNSNFEYGLIIFLLNVQKGKPDEVLRFPTKTFFLIQ